MKKLWNKLFPKHVGMTITEAYLVSARQCIQDDMIPEARGFMRVVLGIANRNGDTKLKHQALACLSHLARVDA